MPSMTAQEATWRPGQMRHAVQAGESVALTFRGRAYGRVVPVDWYERAAAALAREEAAIEEARKAAHKGVAA